MQAHREEWGRHGAGAAAPGQRLAWLNPRPESDGRAAIEYARQPKDPANETPGTQAQEKKGEMKEASLTSALALNDCGCFVPDLTRFTAGPCEGTRPSEV